VRRRSAPVHQEAAESVFIVWDGSGYVCVDRDLTEIFRVVAVCLTGAATTEVNALECGRLANFTPSSFSENSHYRSTFIDSSVVLCVLNFEDGSSRSGQLFLIHSQIKLAG